MSPDSVFLTVVAVAVVVLICLTVVGIVRRGSHSRVQRLSQGDSQSQSGGETSDENETDKKEEFGTAMTATGKDMACAGMSARLTHSGSRCGLDLPRMTMGKLCVDGKCLTADDIQNIQDLGSNLDERLGAIVSKLDGIEISASMSGNGRIRDGDQLVTASSTGGESGRDLQVDGSGSGNGNGSGDENVTVHAEGGDQEYTENNVKYHVFLRDGRFEVKTSGMIQVFLVGGGGRGGDNGGGGGGYTKTVSNKYVNAGDYFDVVVGEGGTRRSPDGEPSRFGSNIVVEGGKGGDNGGTGGSGGALGVTGSGCFDYSARGGEDGSSGDPGKGSSARAPSGQGTTTREFGMIGAKLYGGGGGGHLCGNYNEETQGGSGGGGTGSRGDGEENTGGGGAGARMTSSSTQPGDGGSGIVIVRYSM